MECKSIRKYLVLLQDCLAIKFVPIIVKSEIEDGKISSGKDVEERSKNDSGGGSKSLTKESFLKSRLPSQDESLRGLFLYKEFRETNLQCYWNSSLQETFEQLEYKGTVVPSTILVGFSIRRHMNVLKNAWAQKILKSPVGYRIQFAGEIEELIADPIEKSHFIPLSDSICWAIHELTSNGQEAFVDGILIELASTFPDTVLPSKELLYQMLERLTKAKKIYQTAKGYFVMTEDTRRYISNTDPLLIQQDSTLSVNQASRFPETLESLHEDGDDSEVDFYKINENRAKSPLKRSDSLRNTLKKHGKVSGCLPKRTFSMRSSKSLRKNENLQQALKPPRSSTDAENHPPLPAKDDVVLDRRLKHKSFLSNLLSFRKKSSKTATTRSTKKHAKQAEHKFTISTQTSTSIENLPSSFQLLCVSTTDSNPGSLSMGSSPGRKSSDLEHDSDSGRYTESSSPQSERMQINFRPLNLNQKSVTLPPPPPLSHISSDGEALGLGSVPTTPSQSPCSLISHSPIAKRPLPSPSTAHSSSMSPHSSFRYRNESFNNSYRRKYQNYTLPHTNLLTQKPPLPFKYPPRAFEKKQIYEKISKPLRSSLVDSQGKIAQTPISILKDRAYDYNHTFPSTSTNMNNSTATATENRNNTSSVSGTLLTNTTNSNVELELLLPLGKLISKVLTDFENKSHLEPNENESNNPIKTSNNDKCNHNESIKNFKNNDSCDEASGERQQAISEKSKTVNDLFTIKSFVKTTKDSADSQIQFKTEISSSTSQLTKFNQTQSEDQKLTTGFEIVSFKPFSDYQNDECRESDI